METYDALVELQAEDPRLRIHSISTATDVNMEEIKKLTTYLYERCPKMDHHNLAIIRGDRKNPTLHGPSLKQYEDLYEYIRRLWAPREQGRYGSLVEPMLQWAKVETVKQAAAGGAVQGRADLRRRLRQRRRRRLRDPQADRQPAPEVVPGDLALRRSARTLRESIARKECYCTTEVFLWSSIVYQPVPLANAMVKGKVWNRPTPLGQGERLPIGLADGPAPNAPGVRSADKDPVEP